MDNFDRFPTGKKRKEIVADNKDGIDSFKRVGKDLINNRYHYTVLDSGISGPHSFEESFTYVLPVGSEGLRDYIEKTLKNKKGKAIGIEFGGIGSKLFHEFSDKFFIKSIGVTLVDHRNEATLSSLEKHDSEINHEVLQGNIFDQKTYDSLNKKLNSEKADLIISRMLKGVEFVPMDPYTVSKTLQTWYQLLNENGVMLVQAPIVFNELLVKWVEKIQKEYKGQISIDYKEGNLDAKVNNCSVFRLSKLSGAPKELPLLSPKVVRNAEKYRSFRNGF